MNVRIINSISLFFLLLPVSYLHAQVSIRDSSISMSMIHITYKGLQPAGDMGDRFAYSSLIGVDFAHKFKNNFYLSTGVHGLFGGKVKDTLILSQLITPSGLLINDEGFLSDYRLLQSGIVAQLSAGKIFPILKNLNPNSGLFIELGGQFIRHKINISATTGIVPAISGEYEKGYDRLTMGWGIREAIGFRYFGNQDYINFAISADFSQHITQALRRINYDTGMPDPSPRLDLFAGFRVSWIFLIYSKAPDRVYYR